MDDVDFSYKITYKSKHGNTFTVEFDNDERDEAIAFLDAIHSDGLVLVASNIPKD